MLPQFCTCRRVSVVAGRNRLYFETATGFRKGVFPEQRGKVEAVEVGEVGGLAVGYGEEQANWGTVETSRRVQRNRRETCGVSWIQRGGKTGCRRRSVGSLTPPAITTQWALYFVFAAKESSGKGEKRKLATARRCSPGCGRWEREKKKVRSRAGDVDGRIFSRRKNILRKDPIQDLLRK